MDKEEIAVIEALIQFCPICGHASKKAFDVISIYGGSWICEACGEGIEVNFVELEEVDEAAKEKEELAGQSSLLPLLGSLLLFALLLYTLF